MNGHSADKFIKAIRLLPRDSILGLMEIILDRLPRKAPLKSVSSSNVETCDPCRGPIWTIFGTPMVERWITPRFLSALLTETNIDERPGYGEQKFLERYQLRYLAAGGQIYRQRVVRGTVVFHEAL